MFAGGNDRKQAGEPLLHLSVGAREERLAAPNELLLGFHALLQRA
jgi:hypothetical protein